MGKVIAAAPAVPNVMGYARELEFLGGALEVARLAAMLRIRMRERAGESVRDPILAVTEAENALDPAALAATLDDKRALHAARLAEMKTPPQLMQLQTTFGLDDFEREVILFALAPAIDSSFNALFARAKGQAYRAPLDVDVALTLLCDAFEDRMARRRAFAPSGRLLTHNLLMVGRGSPADGADPFLSLELRLPGRLVTVLLGQESEDEALQAFSHLIEPVETLARVVLVPDEKRRLL